MECKRETVTRYSALADELIPGTCRLPAPLLAWSNCEQESWFGAANVTALSLPGMSDQCGFRECQAIGNDTRPHWTTNNGEESSLLKVALQRHT
jgi:hypothetical protein